MKDEVLNILYQQDSIVNNLDKAIDLTTLQLIMQIKEDRDRAKETFDELMSLFNQGKNSPDDVAQLNKAQEILTATTDQLSKMLTTLARIKIGSNRVQIAQIDVDGDTQAIKIDKQGLIDMLDSITKELPKSQDSKEVSYETSESFNRS
ncbi:MAG: hypothetical protein QXU40_04140 [Candidatus Pacearchaeota archaeon]